MHLMTNVNSSHEQRAKGKGGGGGGGEEPFLKCLLNFYRFCLFFSVNNFYFFLNHKKS